MTPTKHEGTKHEGPKHEGPKHEGSTKRRNIIVAVGLITVIGLAVLFVRNAFLTDSSEAVPTDQAVDRFRTEQSSPSSLPESPDDTTPPADEPARLPTAGVYRYRTTGGESIDAMGGVKREYESETTITVTQRGCGVHLVWAPLEERRDEWDLCLDSDGIALQPGGVQFHEFFGQAETDEVACDGIVALGADQSPGTVTSLTCTLADEPWNPVWRIIGRSDHEVDGVAVAVTQAHMTIEDDTDDWRHTTEDWYLAESGLPVSVTVERSSRSSSVVGPVVYHEQFQLDLVSMTPLT